MHITRLRSLEGGREGGGVTRIGRRHNNPELKSDRNFRPKRLRGNGARVRWPSAIKGTAKSGLERPQGATQGRMEQGREGQGRMKEEAAATKDVPELNSIGSEPVATVFAIGLGEKFNGSEAVVKVAKGFARY